MKLKTLFKSVLIISLVAFGSTEINAQKKTTGKKTTSSRTTATTKKTSSGPALDKSKLENTRYLATTVIPNNENMLIQWIYLNPDGEAVWDYTEDKITFDWKVTGNKLDIYKGSQVFFSETSTNGGKTFTGKMNGTQTCNFYDITKTHGEPLTAQEMENDILAGKYYTFLGCQMKRNSMILGFPVTVKFIKDEETPGSGNFKISGEYKMLSGLGNMKFDYEFGETALLTSKNGGGTDETSYDNWTNQYFTLDLGSSKAGNLFLYFVRK